jgi:hypothetical protein
LWFVKVMTKRKVAVEVRTSWREFEWEKGKLGGIKGLVWVRPDGHETYPDKW